MSTRKKSIPHRDTKVDPVEKAVFEDIVEDQDRHGENLPPVDAEEEKPSVRYPQIDVLLPESIRTQVAVITRVKRALRNHQVPHDELEVFERAAFDGDMDHTMSVVESWVTVDAR